MTQEKLGTAGRLAKAFINNKLTPVLIVSAVALGAFAVQLLPREEEPQIKVPMVDIFIGLPGASAREVEQRVASPVERLVQEVPGVEYVYSTSSPGRAMVIARFTNFGESREIEWTLVKEGGAWKVSDIANNALGWRVSQFNCQ